MGIYLFFNLYFWIMEKELQKIAKTSKEIAKIEIKTKMIDLLLEFKKLEQYEKQKSSNCDNLDHMILYHNGRSDAFQIAQLKIESFINYLTNEIKNGN